MGRVVTRAALLAPALLLAGCPLPSGDDARPDIVLISIDSLRADHLSSYGHTRETTPHLDDLAEDGLRFTRAQSASPWTLPSHLTMLTGLWPIDHQVVEDDIALSPSIPLVTERLKEAGYATAAFVSTVYVSGGYGFARGFDTYRDYGITEKTNLAHAVRVDRLVEDAKAWVKENGKDKPVFLFLHIYDVHYPYLPPEPWNAKFDPPATEEEMKYRTYKIFQRRPLTKKRMEKVVAQYDESLAWVDDELGKLMSAWWWSRRPAYWIVTADHGEEFGERGSWGHAHTLYREALDIPLIVAGPGIEPAVRDELVGTIDVAPTIGALAGLSFAPSDGVDLRGAVPERTFYAETSRFDSARLSLRKGDRRLDLDLAHGERALYDLRLDAAEKLPLKDAKAEEAFAAELLARLGQPWTADVAPVTTTGWLWSPGGAPQKTLDVPGTFGLYPPDAEVLAEGVRARGVLSPPAEGPVRYSGPRTGVPMQLSDETRAQLEALGYVQGDEE